MYTQIGTTQCRKITPEEARKFLLTNTFPGQKALIESRVKLYHDKMVDGTMRSMDVDIAVDRKGTRWLMNGQHVLNANILYGKPYQGKLTYWRCETDDDLWRLFSTYDMGSIRTGRQVIKGARGLFHNPALRNVPYAVLDATSTALHFLSFGDTPKFTAPMSDKARKPELIQKHAAEVLWVASVNLRPDRVTPGAFMQRVGVVTAMIATHRKAISKAEAFWPAVRDVEMMQRDDPRRKLHDRLIYGMSIHKGTSAHTISGGGLHFALYAECVSWWNSWVRGETRRSVKVNSMEKPPAIET